MNGTNEVLRYHTTLSAVEENRAIDLMPHLFIAGKNHFQNQLMIGYLIRNLKVPCEIRSVVVWDSATMTPPNGNLLVLLDCYDIIPLELWKKIGFNSDLDPAVRPIALFNVTNLSDSNFEKQAINKQIRGVFYINEPPERISLGIDKILQGEIWYSRKMTSQVLLEQQQYKSRTEAAEAMLTAREKEILGAIADGVTNNDIAENFHLSLHTVKTHVYNIYRKIDVRNRLEATLWAARYL